MGVILVKADALFGINPDTHPDPTKCLAPAGARILDVLKRLAPTYPFDIMITSGRDSEHSGPNDPHHTGEAFDIRTHLMTSAQKAQFLADLQGQLYKGTPNQRRFYAFLESPNTPNEHIHVQRRAGTTYTIMDYLEDA